MGEAAYALKTSEEAPRKTPQLRLLSGSFRRSETVSTSRTLPYIVAALILFQILDGFLTALGVSHLGLHWEGNPFLRSLMLEFGYLPTLIVTKSLCITIVLLLGYFAHRVNWLERAMQVVACLYLFAAIIPWTFILTTRLFLA